MALFIVLLDDLLVCLVTVNVSVCCRVEISIAVLALGEIILNDYYNMILQLINMSSDKECSQNVIIKQSS